MSSSLLPSYLDPDIFVNHISSRLYREHLENLYWACKSMHKELDKSGKYIYKEICLRHNYPHSIWDLPIIDSYGDQEWYKEGKLDRYGDLPAVIRTVYRYKEGKPHRDGDLPGVICKYWYKEGKPHRDGDLPAVIDAAGDQHWYKEGKRHRDGDLPAIINANGDQYWYKEGKPHRDGDLPAVIGMIGHQQWHNWYKEGNLYRLSLE
jgi:hypothetical protein